MKIGTIVALGVLLGVALVAQAQNERELFGDVDPAYAEQLAEYNDAFLQKATYTAARFRIVRPNAQLLETDGDVTITLFDGVEPLVVRQTKVQRDENGIYWQGTIQTGQTRSDVTGSEELPERSPPSVLISMQRWDLDEAGNAHHSLQNQFQFSPRWRFDELDRPVLSQPLAGSEGGIVGRSPQTPEEITRHKELLRLQKHAFGSVSASFLSPIGGRRYFVMPLEFTPRYSILVEEDPAKAFTVLIDPAGPLDPRPAEEIVRSERYQRFVEGLPSEEGKAVRGDLR